MLFPGPLDEPGLGSAIALGIGMAVMAAGTLFGIVFTAVGAIKGDRPQYKVTETEFSHLSLLEQHRDRCLEES